MRAHVFGLVVLVYFALIGIVKAEIIIVPDDQVTIQAAIDISAHKDTIIVYPGTYFENINFNGKKITLASLFLMSGDTSEISSTIIDGLRKRSVVTFSGGEDSSTVFSGFTIQNGDTTFGGGILLFNSNPILSDLRIKDNWAYRGAGIYCDASSPEIVNCDIVANIASGRGGAIYCLNSSPLIYNNTISNNYAETTGSAIQCLGNTGSRPTVSHNVFYNNTVNTGTIHCEASEVNNPIITNNLFYSNQSMWGGAIAINWSTPLVVNNTIVNNSASIAGGGIYCWQNANPTLVNNIIWGNSGGELVVDGAGAIVRWSNIKGGWTGEGNINANPLFADSMTGDYHLTSGSPCIDAGIALFVWHGDTLFNIPGDKIVGPNPDIGAFEFDLVPISNQRNNQVKTSFLLHQNYPNPFNSTTQIRYSLVRSDYIKVTVYDAQGKVIAKLVNEIQAAGEYNIAWNSTDARENPISSGIYFIELRSKFVQQVRKMLLIR